MSSNSLTEFTDYDNARKVNFDKYDSICILSGNRDINLVIDPRLRVEIERQRSFGKRVMCEFVNSIGDTYSAEPIKMSHHRLIYCAENEISGIINGDILDAHYNDYIMPYFIPGNAVPILVYHDYLCAHSHIDMEYEKMKNGRWALWKYDENTLISSFRLCNFNIARLAPRKKWESVISYIVKWLSNDDSLKIVFPKPLCEFNSETSLDECIQKGLDWFKNSNMLKNNGVDGVREGLSHHIEAKNGVQLRADTVRNDCCGETGGAYFFDYLVNKNQESKEIAENIESFCFDIMQIKEGLFSGMMRWTETAWGVCYQDDVARAIIPTLLRANFAPENDRGAHFENAVEALDFLVKTTGTDGLRVYRTDCLYMTKESIAEMNKVPSNAASAHYNAFYHAALLLAYKVNKKASFLETAEKGLSSIMNLYPDTHRETSETEEMCRLIFPLACLYDVTRKDEYKQWLYRVSEDLQKHRHNIGGYAEWDTGYKANCSRREAGECALLAENGDNVCDLLYSNNWLPLGFAYAYYATKDKYFKNLWNGIAKFMISAQIHSDNPVIDGAWSRAFDMDEREIYGVPHDIGWAPCSVESGWTVGEILTGLLFMKYICANNL